MMRYSVGLLSQSTVFRRFFVVFTQQPLPRMLRSKLPPCVLTIAGSDPSGSAGVQADLKTFAACRVHGLSVTAAITAQNMREVTAVRVLPVKLLLAQLDALHADFNIAAVKIGTLGTAAKARARAPRLP